MPDGQGQLVGRRDDGLRCLDGTTLYELDATYVHGGGGDAMVGGMVAVVSSRLLDL